MRTWRAWVWVVPAVALAAGCGREPEPVDTGSRDAVRGYYEALVQQDWDQAYASLDPAGRARRSALEFARLARVTGVASGSSPSRCRYAPARSMATRPLPM